MRPIVLNYQRKWLLNFIIIIFILFGIAFSMFSYKSSNDIKHSHENFMIELNNQICNSIDIIVKDIDRISFLHIMDRNIESILKKNYIQTNLEYINDNKTMDKVIDHAIRLNPFILGITFIGINGMVYSNTGTNIEYMEQINYWLPKTEALNGERFIIPVHDEIINLHQTTIMSLARVLLSSDDLNKVGNVFVDVDFDSIKNNMINNFLKNKVSETMIIQDDKIIFNSLKNGFSNEEENKIVTGINQKWKIKMETQILNLNIKERDNLLVGQINPTTGWKVIQYVPVNDIQKDNYHNLIFNSVSMIILLIIANSLVFLFSIKISKPIKQLRRAMKKVEVGQIVTIDGEEHRNDEIGKLIHSYNQMALRLNSSINREYVAKVNQNKMELKMLQGQINPHFLYNTLNLISSIAEVEDLEDISTISHNLADMFRYNIKSGDIVTIRDELEQIKKYISIQQFRYPNKIFLNILVEDHLLHLPILKFLLQPLVENAIYHGIEKKEGIGNINITIGSSLNELKIIIQDDGVGISSSQIEEITKSLEEHQNPAFEDKIVSNLGIKNVHFRIRAYYGEQFGLKISSKLNVGTSLELSLPV